MIFFYSLSFTTFSARFIKEHLFTATKCESSIHFTLYSTYYVSRTYLNRKMATMEKIVALEKILFCALSLFSPPDPRGTSDLT